MNGDEIMAKKAKRNEDVLTLVKMIIDLFNPESIEDINNIMRFLVGSMLCAITEGEIDAHLGYGLYEHGRRITADRRNGHTQKDVHTKWGDVEISVPRDRDGDFTPELVPKRCVDVSKIDDDVIAMYAKGLSQRDISALLKEMYGRDLSPEQVSNITDRVNMEVKDWMSRRLKPAYVFMFVDCIYVHIRYAARSESVPIYVVLGIDTSGMREIVGLWVNEKTPEGESATVWANIFYEMKERGVQDIGFITMDGVTGLQQGAKQVFPEAVIQRCIVHLIRNCMSFVPRKSYKEFTADVKQIYNAASLELAKMAFEEFKNKWSVIARGAVKTIENHLDDIYQLYEYPSAVRKIMYTTNAIESVNSSLRKNTKKGAFVDTTAAIKAIYLRVVELESRWAKTVPNWDQVKNQLLIYPRFAKIFGLE